MSCDCECEGNNVALMDALPGLFNCISLLLLLDVYVNLHLNDNLFRCCDRFVIEMFIKIKS